MKLTKKLTKAQELQLKDLIWGGKTVEEVRKDAVDYLVNEGFDREDVELKILRPKEIVAGKLRATSVWCIMFPWFC